MRGERIVLGLGAVAVAVAVLTYLLLRPAAAAPGALGVPLCEGVAAPAPSPEVRVDPTVVRGRSFDPDYPPEAWLPLVRSLIESDFRQVDARVAMRWLVLESDGAPCTVGVVGQLGPDGHPREIGLGQVYNPDDFESLGLTTRGITPARLRAYCASNSRLRTRALTAEEMEDQVRHTLLSKIAASMEVADRAVSRYALRWTTADYWKLVKSVQGLPLILSAGLPAVVKRLGRAPTGWSEFRQVLGMDEMIRDENRRSQTYGGLIPKHPAWHHSLDSAERLARALTDVSVS